MKVAGYIRVSDKSKQADNTSKDEQIAAISSYCNNNKWDCQFFIEEESGGAMKGGRAVKRPIFDSVVEKLNNKEFDILMVSKSDRLARDLQIYADVDKKSVDFKWRIIVATEGIDTEHPYGRLTLTIMITFAIVERERITKRVVDGCLRAKAEAIMENKPYAITSFIKDDKLEHRINYLYCKKKLTIKTIVERLNKEGYKRPVEKHALEPWTVRSVNSYLTHLGIIQTKTETERKIKRQMALQTVIPNIESVKQCRKDAVS